VKRLLKKALWALVPTAAFAASFNPVAVSGYNYAGIVPASGPLSSAQSLDGSNDALFQAGFPGATAGGLPASGVLTYTTISNTFTFGLGTYGGSNLLRVNPTARDTGGVRRESPTGFGNRLR